jgi:Co/Zn/Cd efflux system component
MSDCACEKTIHTRALEARQRRILVVALAIDVATFVMMVAASFVSGSSALLAALTVFILSAARAPGAAWQELQAAAETPDREARPTVI